MTLGELYTLVRDRQGRLTPSEAEVARAILCHYYPNVVPLYRGLPEVLFGERITVADPFLHHLLPGRA